MKSLILLTLVSFVLISACSGFSENRMSTQAGMPASSAPSVHHYRCDSSEMIVASYASADSATVRYKGNTYNLQIAVSGSGSRYVGDKLEWWTKGSGAGSEGTLFRHMADGTTGDRIEQCTEA